MYPIKKIYSLAAYEAWNSSPETTSEDGLDKFTRDWKEVREEPFWKVSDWNELRRAVSFLTLMNKRYVLYFRGQGSHHERCLPLLFRDKWILGGRSYTLTTDNRAAYYAAIVALQDEVFSVVKKIGTPRAYILEHFPGAAAAVLQHYKLWPTHFVDVSRSLPVAVSFAERAGDKTEGILYVFAMPDLRGSITSDMDEQLTLARLEAICPPDAVRPHHQDAYLVSRFPEPPGAGPSDKKRWDDWVKKTNLMRRLVAKFRLRLRDGKLAGAPAMRADYLEPPLSEDRFGQRLWDKLEPVAERLASSIGS